MNLLLDVAIRSSVVLAAGLTLRELLHRRSAAVRHWVLAAAMLGAAAVVPLTLVVPAWKVPAPVLSPATVPAPPPAAASAIVLTADEASITRDEGVSAALIIWMLGVAVGAATLLAGIGRLARMTAMSERVRDDEWARAAAQLSRAFGLTRDVAILQTHSPDMLATWGVFRPCVLLPPDARHWSDERIRLVLCHELAHIRRRDWLVQMGAEAIRIVYWFNPLVWIACARLRRDSEQACDDVVLDAGVAPRDYATHLLQLARICRRPVPAAALPILASGPSVLERRIAAMLTPEIDRRVPSPRAMIATALLLTSVTLPAAAFRAGQTTPLPLKGTVYDASGAVLPEVSLTLEDAQQAKVSAMTDANGHFEFASVEPGVYMLEASLPGFRRMRHSLELRIARDWDRAVTLQVGDVQETITISAPRPATVSGAAGASGPVRIGGNIRPPRKLRDVKPVYPPAMRDAGREGVVPIEAIIGRDGTVTSLRVVSAQVHPDFAKAALDAVREWRFDPTLLNGEPVEVVMNVSVTFTLTE